MNTFKKAVAAGMMIGIGATIFLATESKVAGAFFFSVGLFLICSFGMNLFTGKIGYVLSNKNDPNCLVIWAGNLVGSLITAGLVRIAKPQYAEKALQMADAKMAMSIPAVCITALFCGMLMYAAVENFRRHPHEVSGIFGVAMCVTAFILCGFEHSIADMSYLIFACPDVAAVPKYLLFLVLVSIFNGVGALLLRWLTESKEAK